MEHPGDSPMEEPKKQVFETSKPFQDINK